MKAEYCGRDVFPASTLYWFDVTPPGTSVAVCEGELSELLDINGRVFLPGPLRDRIAEVCVVTEDMRSACEC